MLERGAILEHRYELERELGRGGSAVVYRAHDRKLLRRVAVKVLTPDGPAACEERFAEEARALAELHHPGILELYEVGVHGGHPFLVTELAERGNLLYAVPRRGLGGREVRRFAWQVLDALAHAHSLGILHRDLKPENVLVTDTDQVKLADFGLAKRPHGDRRTSTGVVMGTPEYMAPEVDRG